MKALTLRRACRSEWTKLRTEPGFRWLLAGLVAVTVAVGAATSVTARTVGDPARLALSGVTVGQTLAVVLAVLSVGGEYGSGLIQLTLSSVPGRATALTAKAAALGAVVAVAGAVAVLGSLVAGLLLLSGGLSLLDEAVLRAAVGSVLYLVLVTLLALGITFAVRDGAVAAGAVLALLYLFPLLIHVLTDSWLQRQLARVGPMPAGLAVQATTGLDRLPIGPWTGLGVLAIWSAACLAVGAVLLRRRDA
ncbi:ABC-2 type transport system permease protein [Kitasatospora sp. SolWspMP-SS2h]|uniref:ABC transporter permease n=1 Tax=Kitasatospora sp. SolWspMP-SS2h TaxID=1305729 RepID=UPI000DC02001|nr:ABC transporter permease [Kitasatospora sp. SolWspMP-SS2h]RAJ29692.1 ABC-2 type transport system permease protein [Kitasatospora sp. SolWspMP-SS2h]